MSTRLQRIINFLNRHANTLALMPIETIFPAPIIPLDKDTYNVVMENRTHNLKRDFDQRSPSLKSGRQRLQNKSAQKQSKKPKNTP